MKQRDALQILGICINPVTREDIKQAYRKACSKYHPDRNAAGLEMMKLVNQAYEVLKDFEGQVTDPITNPKDYGDVLNQALNAVMDLGLTVEMCGVWIWISGDTKPHREALKTAGFAWAPKKMQWYFRPAEHKAKTHGNTWSMDKIRETYGSEKIMRYANLLTA